MIPFPYKLIGALLAFMVIAAFFEYDGASRVKARWDKEKAEQAAITAKIETHQAQESVKVVTKYVTKLIKVKDNASGYQQAKLPDTCMLSGSIRLLLDSAAANLPYSASDPYATGPSIEAAAAARHIAANYATCNENSEQLTALQDWVRQMGEVKP